MAEEKPQKKSKRKLVFWLLGGFLALLLTVVIVGIVIIKGYLREDTIVELFEKEYNCRVQIGEFAVDGIAPARVHLKNVWLAPRDGVADAGTPHSDREPLQQGAVIVLGTVDLVTSPGDLLKKELNIQKLVVDGLNVNFLIEREGGTSLDPLFDPPKRVAGEPNEKYEEGMARRERNKERRKMAREEREKSEPETFNASDIPMPASECRMR